MNVWYRYEETRFSSGLDADGEYRGPGRLEIHLRRFKVIRETDKSVLLSRMWEDYVSSDTRWARKNSRKRFACPSIEEARESFRARKRGQIRILEAQLEQAKDALCLVDVGAVQ